jgi:hypothetical protein
MLTHDDRRFLLHLGGWVALTAMVAALLPPAEAFGLDDLPPTTARPFARLRQTVEVPRPEAAAVAPAAPAQKARPRVRREATPGERVAKLLGTRGPSPSAKVTALWGDSERSLPTKALEDAAAIGPRARDGLRGTPDGVDGPAVGIAVRAVSGDQRVDLERVPVTVELEPPPELARLPQERAMSLQPYVGRLRYCYEKRLKLVPGLDGRVELALARDRSPWIVADTTGDEELGRCVLAEARRWDLPEGVDEVTLPVVFRNAE